VARLIRNLEDVLMARPYPNRTPAELRDRIILGATGIAAVCIALVLIGVRTGFIERIWL
jgi:hypothetical protein